MLSPYEISAIPEKLDISADQNEHINSPPLQQTFADEAIREDILGHDPDSLLHLKFSAAAAKWLATRKAYLRPRPFYMAGHHISQLNKVFADITVNKIHVGQLRQYQEARKTNTVVLPTGDVLNPWKKCCGSSIINHEMSVMQCILKRAGIWEKRFEPFYEAVPKSRWKPMKAMTDREEDIFFAVASSNPDWMLACVAASITNNTSAAGTELRHLKHLNLFLDNAIPSVLIPADYTKNDNRGRRIFLNPTCIHDFKLVIERANKLGSYLPEHFLFPKRIKTGKYDPTQPASASWLYKQFHAARMAAGLPWLTPHCLRHQIITRLFEGGYSEHDIQAITGQLSRETLKRYSHNRMERQSEILSQIDPSVRKRVESARLGASRKQA